MMRGKEEGDFGNHPGSARGQRRAGSSDAGGVVGGFAVFQPSA